ncbi:MAG: dCTP deaminase [Candidatus Micrarchaeota archaeon]
MMLSNEDIKRCLADGSIKIEPKLPEDAIGPASVDLTLSSEFWKFKNSINGSTVDLKQKTFKDVTERMVADSVTLKPGDMILGRTEEKITLPADIMGRLEGRSSFARMGLAIHVSSAVIQPGSSNHQVLEIVNLSPFTILLHKGLRVCQTLFERLETPTSKPYAKFGKVARDQ